MVTWAHLSGGKMETTTESGGQSTGQTVLEIVGALAGVHTKLPRPWLQAKAWQVSNREMLLSDYVCIPGLVCWFCMVTSLDYQLQEGGGSRGSV